MADWHFLLNNHRGKGNPSLRTLIRITGNQEMEQLGLRETQKPGNAYKMRV